MTTNFNSDSFKTLDNGSSFRSRLNHSDTTNLEKSNSVSMEKSDDSLSLFIPDDVIENCLDEWKFSLIGRLNLVKLKMETLETSLRKQWNLKGNLQLIPLGKGFFVIKLENSDDRSYIWKGYWIVEEQELNLSAWEPNFNPENKKTLKSFVWVYFPGLSIEYWKESILLQMGNKIGRAIKVNETTLKRQSGYYASVLVEVDLVNYIPSKIMVESKYGKFEQCIQIPKLPKYCIHCKNIGHYVAECRIQRKNQEQEVQSSEILKKFGKKKTIPPKVGFDICNSPKEKCQETPKSVWQVEKTVEATTQQTAKIDNCFSSCSNLEKGKNHEDDDVTLVVSPIQNNTPALNKEKGFTGLLESPSDFPSLSVDKLIDVGASIQNILSVIETPAILEQGWKEVPGSIAKFKNADNNINSGKDFASPSKFQVLVEVAEKHEHIFSKVISKPVKGRLVKPNVITRKQANTSVKSNSNLGGTSTSQSNLS
ncbi:uncharacterized protein LOC113294704 [Papaver somniferum]|uniref:uncharacterized protein LOC113294704 n=1 Tax=Papaver somniferum TaxID=3469 RepID=UPI000E6FD68D|nr:uncharacterized protein LOC113294704 [Papaver somniferum]